MTVEIVEYKTVEAILQAYLPFELDECASFGGIDDEGNEREISVEDVIASIKINRFWGFADSKQQKIHVWIDDVAPPEKKQLVAFLAHERAHLLQPDDSEEFKNLSKEQKMAFIKESDDEFEADVFGEVAAFAYEEATRLMTASQASDT